MEKILIVVDMQNDFVTGALGSSEARNIVPNVVRKVEEARNNGIIPIFTIDKHYLDQDYSASIEGKYVPPHCVEDSWGVQIIPELQDFRYYTAHKFTYAYNCWGDWNGMLQDLDEIEICGVCTDICVISNALVLRSMYPDVQITVDASCCAGSKPYLHDAALEVMKSCNINVINEA